MQEMDTVAGDCGIFDKLLEAPAEIGRIDTSDLHLYVNEKSYSFKKVNQSSALLKSQGFKWEQLSLKFSIGMTTQVDLTCSSKEESVQFYFVAVVE